MRTIFKFAAFFAFAAVSITPFAQANASLACMQVYLRIVKFLHSSFNPARQNPPTQLGDTQRVFAAERMECDAILANGTHRHESAAVGCVRL
jgi:hypothetical protein